MRLIIKTKHTKGTSYDNIHNDAIINALNEQYPALKVKTVYSDFFIDIDGNQYLFDTSDITGYSRQSFRKLQDGLVKEVHLELSVSNSRASMHRLL